MNQKCIRLVFGVYYWAFQKGQFMGERNQDESIICRLIEFILWFFCFFPFITPVRTGTDMQPYALLIAVLFLLIIHRLDIRMIKFSIIGFAAVLLCLTSLIQTNNALIVFRSAFNYISLSVVTVAIWSSIESRGGNFEEIETWIKAFILIWLGVGFVQAFINRSFMSFIISNFRTTQNRGVPGLAPEPSFYGYMCFFFIVFSLEFQTHKSIYIAISVIQMVLLAQSSVALLYLILFSIGYFVNRFIIEHNFRALTYLVIGLMVSGILFYILNKYYRSVRITILINSFLSGNRYEIITQDESISERLEHIVWSTKGFVENFTIPRGFSQIIYGRGRIMSGYGSLLYEMGFIGLVYIIVFFKSFMKTFDIGTAISLTIIMFSAIQIGIPIFSALLGICMYYSIDMTEITLISYNDEAR